MVIKPETYYKRKYYKPVPLPRGIVKLSSERKWKIETRDVKISVLLHNANRKILDMHRRNLFCLEIDVLKEKKKGRGSVTSMLL